MDTDALLLTYYKHFPDLEFCFTDDEGDEILAKKFCEETGLKFIAAGAYRVAFTDGSLVYKFANTHCDDGVYANEYEVGIYHKLSPEHLDAFVRIIGFTDGYELLIQEYMRGPTVGEAHHIMSVINEAAFIGIFRECATLGRKYNFGDMHGGNIMFTDLSCTQWRIVDFSI